MPTLEQLFKIKREGPYTPPIKVKVCGVSRQREYMNSNGEEKKYVILGLADNTMAVKATLYDTTKMENLIEGSSVMLFNIILKSDKTITLTAKTKVGKVAPLHVEDNLLQTARELAIPPPSPEVSLREVELSPVKTMVSVRGQIVGEEIARTVSVKGRDVKVKSVTLKDETGKCKVSLWREVADVDVGIGQHIKVTDVVVQTYNNEKSVSTTSRTGLEVVQAPTERKIEEEIIALNNEEGQLFLCLDDGDMFPMFKINPGLLAVELLCEVDDVERELLARLPVKAQLTVEQEEITKISFLC